METLKFNNQVIDYHSILLLNVVELEFYVLSNTEMPTSLYSLKYMSDLSKEEINSIFYFCLYYDNNEVHYNSINWFVEQFGEHLIPQEYKFMEM